MAWGCLPLIVGIVLLLSFGLFQLIGPALEALAPPASQSPKDAGTTVVAVAAVAATTAPFRTAVESVVPVLAPTATLVPRATSRPMTAVARPSPTGSPTATVLPSATDLLPSATDVPLTATGRPAPAPLPQVEQHVQVGDVRYTVLQIESDGQQIDSPTSSYTTEGMYVRVRVQAEDTGTEVQTAFYPTLVDSQQRLFTPFTSVATRGFVPGDERCTELITLTPNAPVVCQFIYEVPQDATGLRLRTVPYVEADVATATRGAPTAVPTPSATRGISSKPAVATPTRGARTAVPTPSAASGTRIGAVCNDGSHVKATGKIACVLHGGVNHWILAP